jgi:hypothetical protein
MQTRERKGATNSANSGAGNNANRPAGDGRKQEPYLNGHTGKNGGGDDGGLFVATKQTPGGGGSENSTTNGSRETEANGRPPVIIRQEKAEQTPGTFSANSAAGGRDVFYFVDKEKAAHTIEHNGKHYTLRDVNSFVTTYTKRAEEARKLKNEDVLRARLEMVAYWQSRREELLQVMQLAG